MALATRLRSASCSFAGSRADGLGAGAIVDLDALPALVGGRPRSATTRLDERARVAGDDVERLLAGVEPRQPQQILDQPLHPLRVPPDDLEEPRARPRRSASSSDSAST